MSEDSAKAAVSGSPWRGWASARLAVASGLLEARCERRRVADGRAWRSERVAAERRAADCAAGERAAVRAAARLRFGGDDMVETKNQEGGAWWWSCEASAEREIWDGTEVAQLEVASDSEYSKTRGTLSCSRKPSPSRDGDPGFWSVPLPPNPRPIVASHCEDSRTGLVKIGDRMKRLPGAGCNLR